LDTLNIILIATIISYIFTRVFIESFRFIPFSGLYILSDFFTFLLHSVFGYRKKIVYDNLTKAFPEKTNSEIKKIANKTFISFIDTTLKSLKLFTISNDEVFKRFRLLNPELVNK